jgi:hypothetical protein
MRAKAKSHGKHKQTWEQFLLRYDVHVGCLTNWSDGTKHRSRYHLRWWRLGAVFSDHGLAAGFNDARDGRTLQRFILDNAGPLLDICAVFDPPLGWSEQDRYAVLGTDTTALTYLASETLNATALPHYASLSFVVFVYCACCLVTLA